jgi:hypothetical protein
MIAQFSIVGVEFWAALVHVVVLAVCQFLDIVQFYPYDIHCVLCLFDTCFVLCGPLFSIGSTAFHNLFRCEHNAGNSDHYNGAGAYAIFDTLQTLGVHVVSSGVEVAVQELVERPGSTRPAKSERNSRESGNHRTQTCSGNTNRYHEVESLNLGLCTHLDSRLHKYQYHELNHKIGIRCNRHHSHHPCNLSDRPSGMDPRNNCKSY